MYTTGVVNTKSCYRQINHGVTGVGYGVENGQKYYIVRNSWGASWGDKGYIKIAVTGKDDGICGIQYAGIYPTILWKAKKSFTARKAEKISNICCNI